MIRSAWKHLVANEKWIGGGSEMNLRLSTSVSIVVLVIISSSEILGVLLRDLLICHTVTNTRVQLIQGLPL
jgi:hypothetical protein